jgi:formate hydrogenlyase subunit 3/multisubunit Na+/H+ antiporter MnhD subunit
LLGGGVKLSVVPLHVWLGKVHAEASTVGSVLLAGVGLKLGWVVAAWCGPMLGVSTTVSGGSSTGVSGVGIRISGVALSG